ncbi:LOW QUALITY PROTEIN: ribosomal RNA processing protein 1 homolog B-like [Microcaecilia unicolor]|uniref:LOW QUALITY PROTEIN: ribosomal RNA processing protein 1 homolog B-like n=1 Tax=Microcaecilia unicolor TaxID=1415580 RepID=A0A6P7XPP0_9AMPH|nr:LOW QUALITY PROTEIN: ribosomal RNA processing protein 1 homolog B-like [Microcaecilia unicolor]
MRPSLAAWDSGCLQGLVAMAPAVQSVEVQFAQRLASNEKVIRDRSIKRLRKYITAKTTKRTGGFSPEELSKIWKGLFYCMWMQDKPLLQEDLADTISQLTHAFQNTPARKTSFIMTFWQAICREWNGIDRLRLDKFYLLIRMMMRQSFVVLKRNAWDRSLVEEFLNLLMKEVLHHKNKTPNGVRFHFIDIYLEELSKVGADELMADQNLELIDLFCKTAAETKDHILMQAIAQGIFDAIVDQAPFAIEDLMNELKASQSDDKMDLRDEKEKEDGLESGEKSADEDEDDEDEDDEHDGESIGPVLQFDYMAVADRLFELASRKSTPAQNRKRIYRLVKRFQDLAEGIFPQGDFPKENSANEDDEFSVRQYTKKKKKVSEKIKDKRKKGKDQDVKEKLSTIEEEGASAVSHHKKKKRKRKSKHKSSVPEAAAGESVPDSCRNSCEPVTSKEKMKDSEGDSMETCETIANKVLCDGKDNSNCCPQDIPVTGTQNRKKRSKRNCPEYIDTQCENVTRCSKVSTEAGITMVECAIKMKKQKVDPDKEDSLPGSVNKTLMESDDGEVTVSLPVKFKTKEKVLMIPTQAGSLLRREKNRKVKQALSSVKMNVTLETSSKKSKANKANGDFPLNKKNMKMENAFVKFGKKTVPKPLFCRTIKGSFASRTAKQTKKRISCSSKKVTFGLNRNMTAEFKRTDKSILVSPEGASRIAFNPNHKPEHGVLKSPFLKMQTGALMAKKSFHTPVKKHKAATDVF